jgi:hypothetical protein
MAFTPFMQAVPASQEFPRMPTQPMPTGVPTSSATPAAAALVLRYLAHVQDTGRCLFPPLEAHLQRFAREARLREAQEEARLRSAVAEAAPESSHDATVRGAVEAGQEPEAGAMPSKSQAVAVPEESQAPAGSSALVLAEPTSDQDQPAAQATVLQPWDLAPNGAREAGSDEPGALATVAPTVLQPVPLSSRRRAAALTRRLSVLPGGRTATRIATRVLDAAGGAADDAPASAAGSTVDQDSPTATALAALPVVQELAAAPVVPEPARDPRLELLLRFSEEAQRGRRIDPPALQQRLSDCLQARELDRGNSREALERLKQRSHALLGRIRSSLAHAMEQADAQSGAREAGWNLFHRLGQLRAQLEDGFRCYGLRLDRPLHRMLRRQLHRAADQERQLRRILQREPGANSLLSQLEVLADTLETVLDQWLPLEPAFKVSQVAATASDGDAIATPEPPFQRSQPANAIRPAVVVPLRREGA